jgi:hypothetical protein
VSWRYLRCAWTALDPFSQGCPILTVLSSYYNVTPCVCVQELPRQHGCTCYQDPVAEDFREVEAEASQQGTSHTTKHSTCATVLMPSRSASTAAPKTPPGHRSPLASIFAWIARPITETSVSTSPSFAPPTSTVRNPTLYIPHPLTLTPHVQSGNGSSFAPSRSAVTSRQPNTSRAMVALPLSTAKTQRQNTLPTPPTNTRTS